MRHHADFVLRRIGVPATETTTTAIIWPLLRLSPCLLNLSEQLVVACQVLGG